MLIKEPLKFYFCPFVKIEPFCLIRQAGILTGFQSAAIETNSFEKQA